MWKKKADQDLSNYLTDDYKALLRYIDNLAKHKLGYPVSLLTYLGIIDNKMLGIQPGSLANILLNNVGDPFKDSETSLLEVKKHERKIIATLEKYYGLPIDQARGYVTTGGTEGNFAGLWWSKRYLINSSLDKLIATDDAIKLQVSEEQALHVALTKVSLKESKTRLDIFEKILAIQKEIIKNKTVVQEILAPTVFYSKGPTHYSIPKIAEILHLNIKPVLANEDGSINLKAFKKELLIHLGAHPHSPIVVIANIGTTITGAIDDVPGVKKILDEVEPKLTYTIHLDGALTGFVMPILKPFGEVKNYFETLGVNSLAVSAHKYPGLSQPCGIILVQRKFFEKAFEKSERSIDYVGNILDVTITGSRSGLNVLMFYNALVTLGLDKNNKLLEKMVAENLANAKYLYENLKNIYGPQKVFYPYHFNVIFPRPSQALAKKYQLMLTGDRATVCVLTNVTANLIDQFIVDLKADLKKEKTMSLTQTDFSVQTLNEEHVHSLVELFTRSFCDSEPITKHLGMQYNDYKPFVVEVVKKAVKDGLSKVAVNQTGQVIAACIAEDIDDPFLPKLGHYPKLKPVIALLKQLSEPFLTGRKFQKGKVAHVWVAVVDPKYRGNKFSIAIDKACAELLARKGYDFVYAEFTNPLSQKIVNEYNLFQLMNRIVYDEFTMDNGEQPFKGLPGEATAYIIVIRPGIKLSALEQTYAVEEKIR